MPVEDPFANLTRGLDSPGVRHFDIVPSDTVDCDPRPRVIVAKTSGNVALRDTTGKVVVYPVIAGLPLPFSPVRVMATDTTVSVVGWL